MDEIIDLINLALGQKVKMKHVYNGEIGIIHKQITPLAYEIRIGLMSVVASKSYFDIVPS